MTALYLVFHRAAQEMYGEPFVECTALMVANGRCECCPTECPTPKWAANLQEKMGPGELVTSTC